MNTLLIFNMILILSESIAVILTYIISTTLFLKCRWSRRKSIFMFLALDLIPMLLCSLTMTSFYRMLGTNVVSFLLLCLVTRDRFGKKVMAHLIFYTVFAFTEAVVSTLASRVLPEFGPEELLRVNQLRMLDFVMNHNHSQAAFSFLSMSVTLLLIHLIYLASNKNFLELRSSVLRPFAFLGMLQLSLVLFTTYFINAYIRGPYVYVILVLFQVIMMAILFWIIWQMSVTVRRLRTESMLEIFHQKEELDTMLYQEMREELLENGNFRHDFHNQMQIIDYLLENGDAEALKRAENMLKELNIRLENMESSKKTGNSNSPADAAASAAR